MKTRFQIALMCCLLSVIAHFYLTQHYYPLKFGFSAGQSICNINQKFDCDAVAVSGFSSFLGIPLSIWGMVFNGVLFLMILLSWLEWSESPERLRRWTILLSGLSLTASVAMGLISLTQLSNYCLFCIGLYILSLITFVAIRGSLREPFWANLPIDLSLIFSQNKGILAAIIAIPGLSYLTHQMYMQNYGADQLDRAIQESVQDWTQSPVQNFLTAPALVMGPPKDQATLLLAEFADFGCGHCRHASYSLHAFVKAHPDVRFEFYNFPLDGACNDKINGSSGVSCRLASAVQCAGESTMEKGWHLHDYFYNNQDRLHELPSFDELKSFIDIGAKELQLDIEEFHKCLEAPETLAKIRDQAKQGSLVNVSGTPTLFAQGKQLSRGQLIPVLEAVRNQAVNHK